MLYLYRYSLQNGQTFLPGAKQLDYHHDSQLFLCFFRKSAARFDRDCVRLKTSISV